MRRQHHWAVLLSSLATAAADPATFSLGDLKQFTGSAESAPEMTGLAIAYSGSGSPEEGIDIFVSEELQGKVREAYDADCKEINDACYTSVKDVLIHPDNELQPRQLDPVTVGVAVVLGFIAVLFPVWYKGDQTVPVPIHMPAAEISQASEAESATAVVVVTGTEPPVITITPKPEPTTVTGPSEPAVTTFSSAADGHAEGDVMFSMPEDLARRTEEFLRRRAGSDSCPSEPAAEPAKRVKRAADLGAVICGAEGLLTNAVPGYAMADYRVMVPGPLPFTGADAVRAMTTVMQFARDMAPALQLDAATAAQVGVAAFAMAWVVLVIDQPLGAENVIPAASLKGTAPGTEATSTEGPCSTCFANCREHGAIRACTTTCEEQSSCTSSGSSALETLTTVPWTVIGDIEAEPTDAPSEPPSEPPKTECDMDEVSGLPYNVFERVFGKFCEEAKPDQGLTWWVDKDGNKIPLLRRHLYERTPPVDKLPPDAYQDYKVFLEWVPGEDPAAACHSCSDTFGSLAQSPCGHTGGQQNIMAQEGKAEAGCGTYSYKIDSPPREPQLYRQRCREPDEFGPHADISPSFQSQYISWICAGTNLPESRMRPDSAPIVFETQTNDAPYHYSISWIPDCKLTEPDQNPWQPVNHEEDVNCGTLMRENFEKCGNNNGVGGWRKAGCLKYEFKAQLSDEYKAKNGL